MKRMVSLGVASILAVSALAGCSAQTGGNGASETPKNGSEAFPSEEGKRGEEDIEITWWSTPTIAQNDGAQAGTFERELIAAFEKKYPNIKVNLDTIDFTSGPEKLTAAIEAGTVCDILFDAPGRIISYGKAGKLVDLNDMFTDELKKDIDNEALLSSCRSNDNYYMYPLSTAAFTMAFNKDYLEKAGAMDLLDLEGDRTLTTENFEKILEKLHDAGYKGGTVFCSGQGGDQGTRAFISNLYGSQITNPELTEYTINDENGVKALSTVKEWVDKGYMVNGSAYNGGEDIDQFASGNTAFTTLWGPGLEATNAKKLKDGNVTAVSTCIPSESGTPALEYLVNGFCIFDKQDDARAEAAKKFVDFACNDSEWGSKTIVQTGVFPVRNSIGDLYPGNNEMSYYAGLNKYFSPYYNTIDGFAEMRPYWFSMLQAVLNGDSNPKEALDDFVKKSNESIQNAQ